MMPDMPREVVSVEMPPGAVLVLFTDGVTEAENPREEMYEEDRLLSIVRRHRDHSPDEIGKAVFRSVRGFAKGAEQSDDITLLVFKRDR
ncbi:SpoIIE family protein phosphatase, partial [bacterium]|nr:SpoIIE family protein phosphatase [bacterium]